VLSELEYFASHGTISDPGKYKDSFNHISDKPSEICSLIQGLLIHSFWIERYGIKRGENRRFTELQSRSVSEILSTIFSKNSAPLDIPRDPQERVTSTCRDFALILCSILRSKGVPARLRCGFAGYFEPDHFEDHWICEYWDKNKERWVIVDAQLDDLQTKQLKIKFNPFDVPSDCFLTAGKSWIKYRKENIDPNKFGVLHIKGSGLLKANIIRDIFALSKVELLPWDSGWGVLEKGVYEPVSEEEKPYFDKLARISYEVSSAEIHKVIHEDEKVRFPPNWNYFFSPSIKQLSSTSSE
jgi:hypothetical protein